MKLETQLTVERGAKEWGELSLTKNWERQQDTRQTDSPTTRIIETVLPYLIESLDASIQSCRSRKAGRSYRGLPVFDVLGTDVIAVLALRVVVFKVLHSDNHSDILKGPTQTFTEAAAIGQLAKEISNEYLLAKFRTDYKALFTTISKDLEKRTSHTKQARTVLTRSAKQKITEDQLLDSNVARTAANLAIYHLIKIGGVVQQQVVWKTARKSQVVLTVDPTFVDALERTKSGDLLLATDLPPCVIEPKRWTNLWDGGYYSDFMPPAAAVRTRVIPHDSLPQLKDLSVPLDTLNTLQRNVNVRVDETALNQVRTIWESGITVGKTMVSREEPPRPHRPPEVENDEDIRFNYRKQVTKHHESERTRRGRLISTNRIIRQAEQFQQYPQLRYVWRYDFRFRCYTDTTGLSVQGSDIAKGLLESNYYAPLTEDGVQPLGLYGTSLWGNDKGTLKERLEWVRSNGEWIKRIAHNPLEVTDWTNADKPFQFLQWTRHWANFLAHGPGVITNATVGVDGTCNGLQHFAAMLRDPISGAAVNLLDTDKPADIYSNVADRTTDIITQWKTNRDYPAVNNRGEALTWTTLDRLVSRWLSVGVTRKYTKRPVMTIPYSATKNSALHYVLLEMDESGEDWGDDRYIAAQLLTEAIWAATFDVVVAARRAEKWLQRVAVDYVKRTNTMPVWTLPDGAEVRLYYPAMNSEHVRMSIPGTSVKYERHFRNPSADKKLDAKRYKFAISPCLIHSLDAYHLRLVIRELQDIAVIPNHDCHEVHPSNVKRLAKTIRSTFVDLWEQMDPLDDLWKTFGGDPPPTKGDLDIRCVNSSKFFFSI